MDARPGMIFVDTSFFFAVTEPSDRAHEEAMALLDEINGKPLVTTNHIRGETWTLMNSRSGHATATRFIEAVGASAVIQVNRVDRATEEDAFTWLKQHDERTYSFVDATSFAFMRENRITEALAFDGDFTAAGFVELRS